MKILAMSDIHCDWDRFPIDEMPEADCAVVAGDLTDWGLRDWRVFNKSVDFTRSLMKKYSRVYWIPGNHEIGVSPNLYDFYPEDCHVSMDRVLSLYHTRRSFWYYREGECNKSHVCFQGVSCSPCYDMPQLAETWDYMTADSAKEKAVYGSLLSCDILVSHCPPYGYLDNAGYVIGQGEVHIGSKELLLYIERHKPKLVICGHVHEDGGKECMIGETRVVNTARHWKVLEV